MSRVTSLLGLAFLLASLFTAAALGNLTQQLVSRLSDLPLAFVSGRVDAAVGVVREGASFHAK